MFKINLGVIGAGNIAAEHLKAIGNIETLNVIGIASRTRLKAENLAKEYGIPAVYDTFAQLIDQGQPDALLILVSADQIFSVTKSIIPFKLPFFVEKPPGLVPEETNELVGLAQMHNTPNMVGYNRRYYSIFHKGIDLIQRHGRLLGVAIEGHERFWNVAGRVNETVRSNWIFGNSTHTIDLLRFFGGEISNISAVQKSHLERNGDQFAAVLEFEAGAIGNYIAHWYSPGGWSVRLFGQGVAVEFKPLETGVWMTTDFNPHPINPASVDLEYKPGFYRQMRAFAKMLNTGVLAWPGQDLASAYATMLLARQIGGQRSRSF